MTAEFMQKVSERYIKVYKKITGKKFVKESGNVIARIQRNLKLALLQ